VRDLEGNPLSRGDALRQGGGLATAGRLIVIRPDRQMELKNYLPDGGEGRIAIAPSSVGKSEQTASIRLLAEQIPGQGPYVITASCFDSSLGSGAVTLSLNGRELAALKLDHQSDDLRPLAATVDRLRAGDTITLTARPEGGELCRIEELRIAQSGAAVPSGKGVVIFSPESLNSLSDAALERLLHDGGALETRWSTADARDDVFINFLRPTNSDALTLHVLNSSTNDTHHATILDHPACAASRQIELTAAERAALDKPVVSLLGFTPYWTQTYMAREVLHQPYMHKEQTKAWVVVSVNGKEAGRLPLGKIADGWTDMPVDPNLLRGENTVEVRVAGDVGFARSYFGLLIDAESEAEDSRWTPGPWTEHYLATAGDLSPYQGDQQGSFMIYLRNAADKAALPEYNLAHRAVEGMTVTLPAAGFATPAAAFLTPDGETQADPLPLKVEREGEMLTLKLPRVDVYGVVVLANSEQELRNLLAGK